jgi:hypothetical protein
MRPLAKELRSLGYERTERESPFDEDGELWTNSFELVCDKTAAVVRKEEPQHMTDKRDDSWPDGDRHTYPKSGRVKMAGGYVGSYEWGHNDDGRFEY